MLVESVTGWLVPAGTWLLLTRLSAKPSIRAISTVLAWELAAILAAGCGPVLIYFAFGASEGAPARVWIGLAAGIAASCLSVNPRVLLRVVLAALAGMTASLIDLWLQNGWLTRVGASASLGHGAIDVFRLATIGVTTGASVIAANALFPATVPAPKLSDTISPARVVCALVLMGAGQIGLALNHAALALPHISAMTSVLLSAFATGVAYAVYTTGRVRLPMLTRTLTAALIASSACALLPAPLTPAMGVMAAVCALPLNAWAQMRSGVRDPRGAFGMFLAPGLLSLIATGAFASGALLAGWSGVGAGNYLNTDGLGVVGWLVAGDIGQFSAQVLLALTAVAAAALPAAITVHALKHLAPALTMEPVRVSGETGITIPTQTPVTRSEHLDGDSLDKPRKSLPHTRAYKVAYPFSKRARQNRATPHFVVSDDAPKSEEQD